MTSHGRKYTRVPMVDNVLETKPQAGRIPLALSIRPRATAVPPRYVRDGGRAHFFVACLSHLIIDHVSLSRRSTVLSPDRDTSNIWALVMLLLYEACYI